MSLVCRPESQPQFEELEKILKYYVRKGEKDKPQLRDMNIGEVPEDPKTDNIGDRNSLYKTHSAINNKNIWIQPLTTNSLPLKQWEKFK